MGAMMVMVDRAGRVVIPKEVREQLSLTPDAQLELSVEGSSLRLVPVSRPGRSVIEVDGWPVLAPVAGHSVTDADVQRWREDGRR